jgi:hypothetical protein
VIEGDSEGEEESEEEDADGGISVGIKGVAGEGRTGKGLRLCAIFYHLLLTCSDKKVLHSIDVL